jgi:beta-fructofuranosidase
MDGSQQVDVPVQTAPFVVPKGEALRLRIFVDRSIVEVFANGRQCVTQRVYPAGAESTGIAVEAIGGTATLCFLRCWEMAATNPW